MNEYWLGVARELLRQQENGEIRYVDAEGEIHVSSWVGRAAAVLAEVLRTSEADAPCPAISPWGTRCTTGHPHDGHRDVHGDEWAHLASAEGTCGEDGSYGHGTILCTLKPHGPEQRHERHDRFGGITHWPAAGERAAS